MTLRKIADRIEYTHAALYSYFINKEQLLLEGFGLLATDLASSKVGAATPLIAFRRFIFAYGIGALLAQLLFLVLYNVYSKPINLKLRQAARSGEVPEDTRQLQTRWDRVDIYWSMVNFARQAAEKRSLVETTSSIARC